MPVPSYTFGLTGAPTNNPAALVDAPPLDRNNIRDVQVTSTGFVRAGGSVAFVSGSSAIRQALESHLSLWFGTWFLDTDLGVKYLQQVLVKNPRLELVEQLFSAEARRVVGVAAVTSVKASLDRKTRGLTVDLTVSTNTGALVAAQVPLTFSERLNSGA